MGRSNYNYIKKGLLSTGPTHIWPFWVLKKFQGRLDLGEQHSQIFNPHAPILDKSTCYNAKIKEEKPNCGNG